MDREHQSSQPPGRTGTVPAKDAQAKPDKAKPAQAEPAKAARRDAEAADSVPATSAPDIMSRLPKTRPQRASDRRRASTGTANPAAPPAKPRKPAAAKRPAAAARKRAPARATRAAATTPMPAAAKPSPARSEAPSLPRLAVDGATEAVKLPLKVGGRLTLRALDAVARGLRRG